MPYGMSDFEYKRLDPEIRSVVIDLINNGFTTWTSCAGHSRFKEDVGRILIKDPNDDDRFEQALKIIIKHKLHLIGADPILSLNNVNGKPVEQEAIEFSFLPIGSPHGNPLGRICDPNKDRKRKLLLTKLKRNPVKKVKNCRCK